MSSWFSASSIGSSLKGFTEKVQQTFDQETLQKLTLTTPELLAERQRIDREENKKSEIKDMLSSMLPWETADAERDILVEECREAILKLSSDERQTFFGPFTLPESNVKTSKKKKKTEESEESENQDNTVDNEKQIMPSAESLEKLEKLEPLPPLLKNFDLNAHVGLIQKMLSEDPTLVKAQAKLSGGGERERIFWQNYFFHCAFTRYEAGLSIDEIWSDDAQVRAKAAKTASAVGLQEVSEHHEDEEETITFGSEHDNEQHHTPNEKAFPAPEFKKSDDNSSSGGNRSENASYEMVDGKQPENNSDEDDDDDDIADNDAADYELDELEAEIARELED